MRTWIYVPAGPDFWKLKIKHQKEQSGHKSGKWNGQDILWPKIVNKKTICPQAIDELRINLEIDRVIIFDRIKGSSEPVFIKDHINRTGYNFLSGSTPYKNHPTFPDVSEIYDLPEKISGSVVTSVGLHRFKTLNSDFDTLTCQWVGVVASVWKYVGVRVCAVGCPGETSEKEFLELIITFELTKA